MRHFWLGVILLLVIFFCGIGISLFMDCIHLPISHTLEEAASQALSGDLKEAAESAREAYSQWRYHWRSTASAADHQPMDEIDSLFAQLRVYADTQQTAAFAACCTKLSVLIHAVAEAHSLSWWNLL